MRSTWSPTQPHRLINAAGTNPLGLAAFLYSAVDRVPGSHRKWMKPGSKKAHLGAAAKISQSHDARAVLQRYSEISPNKEIPTMPLTTDQKTLTLSRNVIEAFDKADRGPHPGFRPAHAKGILLTGQFKPSPEAAGLTRAPHVQRASTPVTVRFSDFGGVPTVADNSQDAGPRGFALRFHLAEHVHTDIVAHSVDSFPTRTADEFLEFINALVATDPAGPHPNAIEQFLGKHPAALAFVQTPKPIPTSFA